MREKRTARCSAGLSKGLMNGMYVMASEQPPQAFAWGIRCEYRPCQPACRMAANHGNSSFTLVCHPPDFIDSLMRVGGAEFDAARTAVRIGIEIDLTSVPAEQRPIK